MDVFVFFNWNYFLVLLLHHFHFSSASQEQLTIEFDCLHCGRRVVHKGRSIQKIIHTNTHNTQCSMKTIKITPHQITIFFPLIDGYSLVFWLQCRHSLQTRHASLCSMLEINASQFLWNEIFDDRHHKGIPFVNIWRWRESTHRNKKKPKKWEEKSVHCVIFLHFFLVFFLSFYVLET